MGVWFSTLPQTSPSVYIAIIYGGIAILIFCVFLILVPYSYFKHQQQKDLHLKESLKAKSKERIVLKMPSSSIQVIKSITMGSNQSLSIKKLCHSKKRRLDSFLVSCFCGMPLEKGNPHTIYDDAHYDAITKCYQCYICDRPFHFETDGHLLFTCPQHIIPIHPAGFVICVYCVWICYIYQKNIKYYKHFVSIAAVDDNTEAALLRPQTTYNGNYLFDDDDDYEDEGSISMDSYHQRMNALAIDDEEIKEAHDEEIKDDEEIKRTFGCKEWFDEIWSVKHIYVAVLLYIFDTTTGIAVTYLWGQRAYKEYVLNIKPLQRDNVNIGYLFLFTLTLLLFYRIVSCIVIYRQNYNKSWIYRWCLCLLQLFDLLLFRELYYSHFIGRKTANFLLISKMKALFQSSPMSMILFFIVVRSTLLYNDIDDIDVFIIYLSLISAITSILHRFNLEDSYVFEAKANKKWPPSVGYLVRSSFRISEIIARLLVFSLISTVIGERLAFIYAGIDFYVNLRLYRKGLIGPSWMNIVGYMVSVVDLASVPAPQPHVHTLQLSNTKKERALFATYSYSIPGLVKIDRETQLQKQRRNVFNILSALIRLSAAFCTMLMGFWIPYVIGCCNKYLDHFGFVVITSRLYQHTVLLLIMYLMLAGIIDCEEPWCTSDALRSEIRLVSTVLIIIAFISTLLSFVCYLFVSRYLKVGVIATERNPWLAVRVGDVCDALLIFKENHNIKSHEWKRNVFWPKFISSKYSIPNINDFDDKNLNALYRLLKTEDENHWDIPLIKAIAFDAVQIKFDDIFELFFHPKILSENEGFSPLLNPYTCIDNKGNYLVHEAAKAGSVKILKLILHRAKIPVLNKLNETPLHLACRLGDVTVIEMLLNAWSLTTMDKNGRYPIHYGVETANKRIVSLMMDRINHLFEAQYTENQIWSQMLGSLLLSCAQNSNQNMFEYILNIKSPNIVPNFNYKLKTSGLAAIHYAVLTRNINICKILLKQEDIDCNIICDGDDGMSPLMMAVENNDVQIVNYLLSNADINIDVNIQTLNRGYTALHFAFLNGEYNIEIIRTLCQHPNIRFLPDFEKNQTPLHLALLAVNLQLKDILAVLRCKPSKSVLNQASLPHKDTLLHIAAMQNNADVMEMLLELGADPNIINADDHTCYDIAHHMEIYEKRLECMQLTNIINENVNNNDNTHAHMNHMNHMHAHRKQEIDALLQSIPSSVIQVSSDKTLTHQCIKYFWRAIEKNDYEITRILLQQNRIKVDEFVRSGRFVGQTALHIACTLGHYETLIILMDEGDANVNIQSKIDLATPLLCATRFNHINCVAYLLNAPQINVNIAALDETTPFYEAVYSNHVEIIKLLLKNPHLNIQQKTRNKRAMDIINAYIIDNKETEYEYNGMIEYNEANEYYEHPFESQVCKYCNFALEEEDMSLFRFFWDICVLDNLNNPTFVFLHVLCKEGHFNLLKYLIFYNYTGNEVLLNWIVKDGHCMYPIQYLVEWFQYDNTQTNIKNDSQWILSYILQRTFGSLMLDKMEHVIWTNCTSTTCMRTKCKSCNVDWNRSIKLPSPSKNESICKELKPQNKKRLKEEDCAFLNHLIISMFGLRRCHWILNAQLQTAQKQNGHMFNALICTDISNVNGYYEGVRSNERTYCAPYQFNHVRDITIYLDAMQTLETGAVRVESLRFPLDSFNSLCSLILCDDIPLHQLQYLLDILRNLLSYPSIHPLIVDLIFIEKMLNKICIEMEEYLMRDGSSLKNEITVFAIEATAIAAVTNCYKYPTVIRETILDIVYPLLSHSKSPNIRLMTAKLLYNISLQIRITQFTAAADDEDELKMEYEPSKPADKLLSQQICDEIIGRLNHETDVRVRCICLQTLKLLMISNSNLVAYATAQNNGECIAYDIWNERDSLCCVNGALHHEMMHCLQLPLQPNQQLSKAMNDDNINNDDSDNYEYEIYDDDEFKFEDEHRQKTINQDEGDNKYDDDEEDPLLPIMGDMTTTNIEENDNERLRKTELNISTRNGAELKKIYSEGANILCNQDNEANQWRETVLINSTPNAPEMAFSKFISEKTLAQISQNVDIMPNTQGESTDTINITLLKHHSNEDKLRPAAVGFAVLGHAQNDEQIAFALNDQNNMENELDSGANNSNQSDDDNDDDVLLNNNVTLMHDE